MIPKAGDCMDSVAILGTRGSVPRADAEFSHYGGDTVCVRVELAGETILLDAGTGLMNCTLPAGPAHKPISLLLSHYHTDHLIGLPLSPLLLNEEMQLVILGRGRDGRSAEALIDRVFSPPFWPVRIRQLPAQVSFRELPGSIQIGAVTVATMDGCHPDGVTLMKLSSGEKRIVYLPDCEVTEELFPPLVEFAKGCSLLLCDGQYSDEEWELRRGFGHSSWNRAVQLGLACGAERIRIIHHDPFHTDAMLAGVEPNLTALHPDCGFALAREEIEL